MYLKLKKLAFILFLMTSLPILSQSKDRCISGDCQNGKGVLVDADGNKLIGSFLNGKLEGFAEVEFKDGDKFSGIYKNGERNGKGKLVHSDGKVEFEGEWIASGVCITGDCHSGKGTLKRFIPNSDVTCEFSGPFLSGKINGKGKFICSDQETYEGNLKDSKPHGFGIQSFSNGTRYEGEFKEFEFDGKGKLTWNTGANESYTECTFQGTFKQSQKIGKGSYSCNNGEKFEGLYLEDKPNGKGKLIYSDGSKYEGEFKDGFPHGNGTEYDSEGKISKTGIFKNGYKYFNIPTFDFINKTWVKPEKWLGGSLEKSQVFFIQYLSEPDFLGIETTDGSPDFSDPHLEKTYVEAKVNGFLGTIILCIDKKQEPEMDKFLTKPMVLIEFDGRIVGYNKGESGIKRELIVNVEAIRRMGHAVLSSKAN
ncbi:membrane-binding protein [Leptospira interrogans]|uniref:Membrane-binding protein n=1 Tax=Leptospira interrogans TaxID=173 RepID=A0AAV9FS62_LEPIR|nr:MULTISPECIES: membrane-binding protein [Leptospira]KAK2618167.1 membrane-binding protein [Leptospira interrogans]